MCGIDAHSVSIRKTRQLYTIMSAQLFAECSVSCLRQFISQERAISVRAKAVVSPINIRAMMNNTAQIIFIELTIYITPHLGMMNKLGSLLA